MGRLLCLGLVSALSFNIGGVGPAQPDSGPHVSSAAGSSEQHDRSSQGRGPNSPIVALIQLGPLGCPAVHFGAQWLTVDIAVQVASLRGRRTLTFKNHIQVAHSCVVGTPLMNGHGHPFSPARQPRPKRSHP
jgi:hypothetical protein